MRALPLTLAVGGLAVLGAALLIWHQAAASPPASGLDPAVATAVAEARRANPELFRRKVVLLGFDSCDPDLVDQYVREGKLPHFARLRREGAYGPLATIQPVLSPVVWTTIATGMAPQRHGILDFVTETPTGKVPVSAKMRQADTVWELLSQQGEEVGVVGWLVTWPAEKTNGFIVTERMGRLAYEVGMKDFGGAPQRTWPESLASELTEDLVGPADVTFGKVRPFLDISEREFDVASSSEFRPGDRVGNLRLVLATAETFRNIGERLYAEKKPRFFACYFEAMDAISHLFMPFAPPKSPNVETDLYLKYRNAIEADYVWHDRVLGEFMDLCDADTTLLVVSDHGFKNGDFRISGGSDFFDKTGAQWHRPFGVFYAWGNGVKRGASVPGARVYDVAPTILAAMGYPRSDEMQGRVLQEAFEDPLPVRHVLTYRGDARRDEMALLAATEADHGVRSPDEEDQLKKLESLGYIGGSRSDPSSTGLNLGATLLSQGRPELAYKEFEKSLEKARADVAAGNAPPDVVGRSLASVAEACLRTGRLDEAEKCIKEALAIDAQDLAAMTLSARMFLARANLDEAEKAARAAVSVHPDMHGGWATLGFVLQARENEATKKSDEAAAQRVRKEMIEVYEQDLKLEPRQEEALFLLSQTRLSYAPGAKDASAVAKAKDEIDRVLEINPQRINAYNNRAAAHLKLGSVTLGAGRVEEADREFAAALADAEKAISLSAEKFGRDYPGYPKAWANKAYVLCYMGRMAEAAEAAKRTLAINPSYPLNASVVNALRNAGHPVGGPASAQQPPAPVQTAPTPEQPQTPK